LRFCGLYFGSGNAKQGAFMDYVFLPIAATARAFGVRHGADAQQRNPLPSAPKPWSVCQAVCGLSPAAAPSLDEQFIAMLNAFRPSGGLARGHEVLASCKHCASADISALARWIVRREVIGFEWQQDTWLPLFQFSRPGMTPHPALAPVLTELKPALDVWETACWFAQPNAALHQQCPANALTGDPFGVLQAARAARFMVTG
jgi:hypothetical protein